MRHIDKISIHFSDSPHKHHDNVETIHNWHIERGWKGTGYHYLITWNGDIHDHNSNPLMRSIEITPAAVKNHNTGMIAICLTGRDKFTEAQFKSLRILVQRLMKEYNVKRANVKGHNEWRGHETRVCPNFDVEKILWDTRGQNKGI